MVCTYNRAYRLGKDRSGAGVDSRVPLVIRLAVFESHLRSLRVLPFLPPGSMSQQSTARYAIVPTSTPPLPSQPTPGLIPGVSSSSEAVSPGATQGDRWGRIRRYPVLITFSIIVFFVLLIIMIMLLTLNEGVQQLYNQMPHNVTGVSFSGFRVLGFRRFNVR